jgi:hypothetical protein
MRALARPAAAVAFSLGASACTGAGPVACPHAIIMPELQAVAKFRPGPGRQDSDVTYGARLLAADTSCTADKKKGGVNVATKLGVAAIRVNPDVRNGQITYFVAVIDRKQAILNKRDFTIDLDFPRNQSRLEITEQLEEFIWLSGEANGADYGIVIGFELTPEELQYNREHAPKAPGSG